MRKLIVAALVIVVLPSPALATGIQFEQHPITVDLPNSREVSKSTEKQNRIFLFANHESANAQMVLFAVKSEKSNARTWAGRNDKKFLGGKYSGGKAVEYEGIDSDEAALGSGQEATVLRWHVQINNVPIKAASAHAETSGRKILILVLPTGDREAVNELAEAAILPLVKSLGIKPSQ